MPAGQNTGAGMCRGGCLDKSCQAWAESWATEACGSHTTPHTRAHRWRGVAVLSRGSEKRCRVRRRKHGVPARADALVNTWPALAIALSVTCERALRVLAARACREWGYARSRLCHTAGNGRVCARERERSVGKANAQQLLALQRTLHYVYVAQPLPVFVSACRSASRLSWSDFCTTSGQRYV